jgi:hypothetical protein
MKTLLALALVSVPWLVPAPRPQSTPDVDELAWLAGHWVLDQGGLHQEELWTAPMGGTLLGLHRDVHLGQDRTLSFEYLRIVEHAGSLRYLASPGGKEPTPFDLVELTADTVVFANEAHDFPKRIRYALEDGGKTLHGRVEGNADSKQKPLEWRWKRVE